MLLHSFWRSFDVLLSAANIHYMQCVASIIIVIIMTIIVIYLFKVDMMKMAKRTN